MANGTANVIESTETIQKEMQETRESITEKVAALENHVMDTVQSVTGTVDAVKDTVTSAPAAIRESVDVVKQTLHEQFASLQLGSCVRNHPWSAVGVSILGGFLLSQRLFKPRSNAEAAGNLRRPSAGERETLFTRLADLVGDGVHRLAENSVKTAMDALNRSVGTQVPDLVDSAVRRFGSHLQNGTGVSRRS